MAKQVGPLYVTGTIDGIVFYKLGDQYYMRSKGDYKSGKQMRKDRRYTRTLEQADRFGVAAKLVRSVYYRHLPRAVRRHGLYGKLTGMVNQWLYRGKSKEEAKELLLAHLQSLVAAAKLPAQNAVVTPARTEETTKSTVPTTNADQPTTVNAQHPTVNRQPSSVNQQQLANTEQTTTINTQRYTKHPRYLSRWKVNRKGRLLLPQRTSQPSPPLPLRC